jgi:hypothetical protein
MKPNSMFPKQEDKDNDFLSKLEGLGGDDNEDDDEESGSIMDRRTKQSDLDRLLIPFDEDEDDSAELQLPTCYDDEEFTGVSGGMGSLSLERDEEDDSLDKYFMNKEPADLFKATLRKPSKSMANASRYKTDDDDEYGEELEVENDFDDDNDRDEDFSSKYLNVRNSIDTIANQCNDLDNEDLQPPKKLKLLDLFNDNFEDFDKDKKEEKSPCLDFVEFKNEDNFVQDSYYSANNYWK